MNEQHETEAAESTAAPASAPAPAGARAATSDQDRRAITFLIAKVAIFMLVPLLASAIAVYVML